MIAEKQLTDRADVVDCSRCGCGAQYDYGDEPLCTLCAMKSGDWLGFLIRCTEAKRALSAQEAEHG